MTWRLRKAVHLLQSCSMVAHCSDFFHVWASSSSLVLTASSSKLMLSCKKPKEGSNVLCPRQTDSSRRFLLLRHHNILQRGCRKPHRLSL